MCSQERPTRRLTENALLPPRIACSEPEFGCPSREARLGERRGKVVEPKPTSIGHEKTVTNPTLHGLGWRWVEKAFSVRGPAYGSPHMFLWKCREPPRFVVQMLQRPGIEARNEH